MKDKYKDQDEEERLMRMELLAVRKDILSLLFDIA
jgi:hypothetical protein